VLASVFGVRRNGLKNSGQCWTGKRLAKRMVMLVIEVFKYLAT